MTDAKTASIQDPLEASLQAVGLTREQALVYRTLLTLGPSKAFRIAFASGVKRALTYKILDQLESMGLITARETPEAKVTTFSPAHPSSLEKLIEQKREGAAKAEQALGSIMQTLTSNYNIANRKPNVQFFEGERGLEYVFDDIIREKADVLLFRSQLDTSSERVTEMIDEHKERRKRLGLKVRVISSRTPTRELSAQDKANNMTRRYLPEEKFALPAQISVYGDKVAITSYGTPLVTTVVENPEIRQSFATLFELTWSQSALPETLYT